MAEYETHEYDVIIVGAGGAGLRAAIEARSKGLRTALVCKSLLGKAHTVMAEGGVAAALGNVYAEDSWKVHFRDTMRGGKMLNNWRMAQLHAQEAPDRVRELEDWGALFDRTKDGLILQRDFGGHRFARLAHIGDRTGLEMIRTLQQKAVSDAIDVFMEVKVLRLLHDADGTVSGRRWLLATLRGVRGVQGQGRGDGHRRCGKELAVHLQLVGVDRGRARHVPVGRCRSDRHGVGSVPPDRDGVAPVRPRASW